MNICSLFVYLWMGYLVSFGIGEKIELQRAVASSAEVALGDTEDRVLELLGEPDYRWAARRTFFFPHPAQWVYGTTVDLEFLVIPELGVLNPIPIHLRLFSADTSDLVIEWTEKRRVSKVTRPETHKISDEIVKIYEAFEFVDRLNHLLGFREQPVMQ